STLGGGTFRVKVGDLLAGFNYHDVDNGAQAGIAITDSFGPGTWKYSTDGGITFPGTVVASPTSAILLRSNDFLAFNTNVGSTGRGWDGSGPGNDPGTGGGTSPFSIGSASMSFNIVDVPFVYGIFPALSRPYNFTPGNVVEGQPITNVMAFGFTDPDSNSKDT